MTPAQVAAEVLTRITDQPRTYDQKLWLEGRDWVPMTNEQCIDPSETVETWADCGTTACVAGHAAHVIARATGRGVIYAGISRTAGEGLALGFSAEGWLFDSGRTKEEVTAALRWLSQRRSTRPVGLDDLTLGAGL
ncbi:MAG: hypothetical protein OXG44_17425 [Gammaproteobacteria bacterium]|nr:hypothetical protein [Gammaproteobacteria bacterium]